jgi:CelD/BcsL family acetyltransferase involved in cellulose biosynthesis
MLETQLNFGPGVFHALAREWDNLASRAMTNTPFQLLAYQRSWWNHLGPGELFTITQRNQGNELVAIACFYMHEGVLRFNGCVEETDYLDIICEADAAELAWTAVLECLTGGRLPPWRLIELCNVPEWSRTRQILPRLAQRQELHVEMEIDNVCPVIKLPASFEAYLGQLDKKQRHEIRRKQRKAEAAGAKLRLVGPEDDLEQAVDDFLYLLELSTPEKKEWLTPERRALFADVARAAMDNEILQLMFLEQNGTAAAVLFNFDYDNRIWVYNSGLDVLGSGHLSPGVVLTAKSIASAIELGRQEFDFLRGDEVYKYRFGAEDTHIYRLIIDRSQR